MKIRKRRFIDKNVYDAELERIRKLFFIFGDVAVSFSGGKDSTAVLECVRQVAEEMNKLPIRVLFFDEEANTPHTVEYVKRVAQRPEFKLEWYALEFKHRNACSNADPYWYCWDKTKRDLWVNDMPEQAITTHPLFEFGMSYQEFCTELVRGTGVPILQGIRAEESLRRLRIILSKTDDCYITRPKRDVVFAYPIYDWLGKDVWRLVKATGIDYNRHYDLLSMTRKYNKFTTQRVCQPYGEEPLRGLDEYWECFPSIRDKLIARVGGVNTAYRYSNTPLYGVGAIKKPGGFATWKQYIEGILLSYEEPYRSIVAGNLNSALAAHKKKTTDPVPDDSPHSLTGISWRALAKIAIRGDFKQRSVGMMSAAGEGQRNKLGITLDEAKANSIRRGATALREH